MFQDKLGVLRKLSFGKRVAEEEASELASYFVETQQWRDIFAGGVDVVYGAKGAGKSAIYALLQARTEELFAAHGVLCVNAENPRGAPVFEELTAEPPLSEVEFRTLWKLYFLTLIAIDIRQNGISLDVARELVDVLEAAHLIPSRRGFSLRDVFRSILNAIRTARVKGVEHELETNPTGATIYRQRVNVGSQPVVADISSSDIDRLFSIAEEALKTSDVILWVLLDRLDVAFAESPDLEKNALRALFRVYMDLNGLEAIRLKIFIRSDIWERITDKGFREASHITRTATISWDRQSLMNLVVRRLLHNRELVQMMGEAPEAVLADANAQDRFFYSLFPDQIDIGPNKSKTFEWLLSRTTDGKRAYAPRELIHLLEEARELQVKKLELGENQTEGDQLFGRLIFKEALPSVSTGRLNNTLLAEYPQHRSRLMALQGEKTDQTPATLSVLWKVSEPKAMEIAKALTDVGFFEERGTKSSPRYWVPFLYRDSLSMVQGAADKQAGDADT